MKKSFYQFKVDSKEFRRIKKNRQSVFLQLNDEGNQKINVKDKIIIVDSETNKQIKRKVKKLHKYSNFHELFKNVNKKKLGYGKKENVDYDSLEKMYSKQDISKYGILGIEVSSNNIFKKVLFVLLVLLLAIFMYNFISKLILDANNKKVAGAINELEKEKISYVFIEINPSLVLTVQDNKVSDVACLNDDCMSFYDEIDIKGKTIDDGIDNIYNLSKQKGFDVSKGVTVKTTNDLEIANKDYVKVEYIDNKAETELLADVKNNEDIVNSNNDNYYDKLWQELKKDSEYGKVYSCKMNNDELGCYFIMSSIDHNYNKDSDYNFKDDNEFSSFLSLFNSLSSKVTDTLSKFGVEKHEDKVYMNNIKFGYVPLFTLNGTPYKNVLRGEKIDVLDPEICRAGLMRYDDNGKCQINDGYYIMPIETINLLNPNASLKSMIVYDMGISENAIRQYEAYSSLGQ